MKIQVIALTFIFCGCSSVNRTPASISRETQLGLQEVAKAQDEQQDLRHEIFFVNKPVINLGFPIRTKTKKYDELNEQLRRSQIIADGLKNELSNEREISHNTENTILFSHYNKYEKIEHLNIDKSFLKNIDGREIPYEYIIDSWGQANYFLAISSQVLPPHPGQSVHLNIKCNGPFYLSHRSRIRKKLFTDVSIELQDEGPDGTLYYFSPTEQLSYCQVQVRKYKEAKLYTFNLKTNAGQYSSRLAFEKSACLLPRKGDTPSLDTFFTASFHNLSCPIEVPKIELLDKPYDGLNKKVEMLIGYKIPDSILDKQDPYIDIDFSKAPKLKAIYISYLVFRKDFYGTLLLRLLEWHARRGTEIRIFNAKVVENKKDNLMLTEFAARFPNVKYQSFKYPSSWKRGLNDKIEGLHRTNHIKAFVVLSASDTKKSGVVLGGRNVHDGFVFKNRPDHSSRPDFVQYDGKDESYVHWMDLEAFVPSHQLALDVARQVLSIWNYDHTTAKYPSVNVHIKTDRIARDPKMGVRHMYSNPYQDDHQLETFYVELFDSAQKKIRLVSPYLRLTEKLVYALDRAIARGVDISIYTRIDLKGDTADIILTDVNKQAINRLKDKVKIYEWTEPGVILHPKIVLIDNQLSFIGGVNLNKRSFLHDFENGLMIYGRDTNEKLNKLVDSYEHGSRLVTEQQNRTWWIAILITLLDDKF